MFYVHASRWMTLWITFTAGCFVERVHIWWDYEGTVDWLHGSLALVAIAFAVFVTWRLERSIRAIEPEQPTADVEPPIQASN